MVAKIKSIFTAISLRYVFLTIVMLELFLGGTGRLTEFNSFLTLRMCLFIAYLIVTMVYFIYNRSIAIEIVIIICYFLIINILAAFIGLINGATVPAIFEDIKPLLNIFLLLYLFFTVRDARDVNYIINLLKLSAILLSILHFALYYVYLKFNDIAVLYSTLNNESDANPIFLFKGESGFVNYPGDIYLCVGFIAWDQYHPKSFWKYLALLSIIVSIFLTGTRGLIVALAAVYITKWLFLKLNYKSLLYFIVGLMVVMVAYLKIINNIGDKEDSDQTRFEQITEVTASINPVSAFIGHGYGIGVPVRPVHMEISYLEIFHKQGLIGLFYYLLIILITYLSYTKCRFENGVGFYMFVLFIFFLSFTNPYVNHPLGITVISVSIVSMLKVGKLGKNKFIRLF